MCDINTGKRGDIAIINTNVAYNLVERHSTGHIGGRVGGREGGGEDDHDYEVIGTPRLGCPSQRRGESSSGRGGTTHIPHPSLAAINTGRGGGEEGACPPGMRTYQEDSDVQD